MRRAQPVRARPGIRPARAVLWTGPMKTTDPLYTPGPLVLHVLLWTVGVCGLIAFMVVLLMN